MNAKLGYIGDCKAFNINDFSREQLEKILKEIVGRLDNQSPVKMVGETLISYCKRLRFHYPETEQTAQLSLITLKRMYEAQD